MNWDLLLGAGTKEEIEVKSRSAGKSVGSSVAHNDHKLKFVI
jgi:hypothetical protein